MPEDIEIREIAQADFECWINLAGRLWPTSPSDELKWVFQNILHSDREAGVIARLADNTPIAFMNLSLRYDYVSGATDRPVAYLEGIYVIDSYRKKGVASRFLKYAEDWAADHGCTKLASDALLENVESQSFHKHVGFREVSRTVSFIKDIEKHS